MSVQFKLRIRGSSVDAVVVNDKVSDMYRNKYVTLSKGVYRLFDLERMERRSGVSIAPGMGAAMVNSYYDL